MSTSASAMAGDESASRATPISDTAVGPDEGVALARGDGVVGAEAVPLGLVRDALALDGAETGATHALSATTTDTRYAPRTPRPPPSRPARGEIARAAIRPPPEAR